MQPNSRKTLVLATLIPIVMFGFGFALVPLYDVFCRVTGLNGKVNTSPLTEAEQNNRTGVGEAVSRGVRVQFVTMNNGDMPWEFAPLEHDAVKVQTGEDFKAMFRVTNTTNRFMQGRAVPSVSPSEAAQYFHKVQCFCFDQQDLEAGESLDMPVVFEVDKALPDHIQTITLAYTLFDVTQVANNN